MNEKTHPSRYHVISSGQRWCVKRSGAKRATSLHDHREEAYHKAMLLSCGHVVVHRKDGSVDFITHEITSVVPPSQ